MISRNLLRGENIRLTAVYASDIRTMAGWYDCTDIGRFADARPAFPKTEEAIANWIREHQQSNNNFIFAIRPIGSEELVGYIGLDGILWTHGVAGLGIGIGNLEHRNKGFGKEAIRLMLDFAFRELNLHRIQLSVFSYNKNAIAAYEKVGFKREGTYREFINRDGKRWDMYLYGILSHEWLQSDSKRR